MAIHDEFLALNNKLKTYQSLLKFLAIGIYRAKNKLNPRFKWKTFKEKNTPYSLRMGASLSIPNVSTQKYGIHSLNFRGSVLWNNLPIKLKNLNFYKDLSYC